MKRDKSPPSESERLDLEQQVEALQREIRNLKLEHDLLTKANELLEKNLGVDPQLLSNQEKTMLVDALREEYALRELLHRLDLPRSSYFYHRSPLRVSAVTGNDIKRLTCPIVDDMSLDPGTALGIKANLFVLQAPQKQIDIVEEVLAA